MGPYDSYFHGPPFAFLLFLSHHGIGTGSLAGLLEGRAHHASDD